MAPPAARTDTAARVASTTLCMRAPPHARPPPLRVPHPAHAFVRVPREQRRVLKQRAVLRRLQRGVACDLPVAPCWLSCPAGCGGLLAAALREGRPPPRAAAK